MALTRNKFQSVAEKMFAKAKTGNLTLVSAFKKAGGYDPVTGTSSPATTDTVDVIREDYNANEIDGDLIKSSDFKLLARTVSFVNLDPKTSGITAVIEGVTVNLEDAQKDAADAVWTLQMRKA